jgi:hypothetical protein
MHPRIALAAALGASLVTAAAAAPAGQPTVLRGSYTLDAHGDQAPFRPGLAGCFPGVAQRETLNVSWTIRFPPVDTSRLLARGRLVLAATSFKVSGKHRWEEASTACPAQRAGNLVCRSHFSGKEPTLTLEVRRGSVVLHPNPGLVSNSDGCKGEVYNEHPDCGTRDAIGITDFRFRNALARRAPRIPVGALNSRQPTTKRFDVPKHGSCTKHGKKNPNLIRQRVSARYRGSVSFGGS